MRRFFYIQSGMVMNQERIYFSEEEIFQNLLRRKRDNRL